jgi:hypothetical protein
LPGYDQRPTNNSKLLSAQCKIELSQTLSVELDTGNRFHDSFLKNSQKIRVKYQFLSHGTNYLKRCFVFENGSQKSHCFSNFAET